VKFPRRNIKYLCLTILIQGPERNIATYTEMHGSIPNNVTLSDALSAFLLLSILVALTRRWKL